VEKRVLNLVKIVAITLFPVVPSFTEVRRVFVLNGKELENGLVRCLVDIENSRIFYVCKNRKYLALKGTP